MLGGPLQSVVVLLAATDEHQQVVVAHEMLYVAAYKLGRSANLNMSFLKKKKAEDEVIVIIA